jgi:CheY-like chemotaxis protein
MPPITNTEANQIVSIGNAYGGRPFWLEILREDSESDNIRRALLFIASLGIRGAELAIRLKLRHPSSRVRAAACKAVGRLMDLRATGILRELTSDPAILVRTEAHYALATLRRRRNGSHHSVCHSDLRGPRPLVLVSDDSRRVHQQISRLLSPYAFRMAFASTLVESIDMARLLFPDAIITDNQKGRDNRSGLRLTEAIANDQAFDNTTLIMISADRIQGPFLWEGGDVFYYKHFVPVQALAETVLGTALP